VIAKCLDGEGREKELQILFNLLMCQGGRVSHNLDVPVVHAYRGHTLFLKFEWRRPNDDVPAFARIIEPAAVAGLGEVAAELTGPWPDYPAALGDAMAAAERWIDSQLP
jgi:hypothetical protein